jgi:putative alpha-1,2-mannosidase
MTLLTEKGGSVLNKSLRRMSMLTIAPLAGLLVGLTMVAAPAHAATAVPAARAISTTTAALGTGTGGEVPQFNKIFYRWKPVSQSPGSSGHNAWSQCGYYDYRNGPDNWGCSITESTSNTVSGTLEVSLPVLDGFLNLGVQRAIGHEFSVGVTGTWVNMKKGKLIGYAAWTQTYAVAIVKQQRWECQQHHAKPICNNPANYFPTSTVKNVDVTLHSFRMTFLRCAHTPSVSKECPFP